MPINSVKPNINPIQVGNDLKKPDLLKGTDAAGFKDALKKVAEISDVKNPAALQEKAKIDFKFSNHAVERMRARGIHYSPKEMSSIQNAINSAKDKGAKETLVLTDKSAMIVSVKNSTVVTVMDKDALKENVFTNIDSTVVI